MKYNVTLSYHGSITLSVEAENEQKALEAARNHVGKMSDSEFNEAIDLMEHDTDVYEDVPEDKAWVKPRFTANDILKGAEYHQVSYLDGIRDSMELDSAGKDLAYLENSIFTRCGRKLLIDACVRVVGDVRVLFKDQWYRNASSMPKDLLDCYHNGKDPHELDPDYYVSENNWFEMFITIKDGKETVWDSADVIDDVDGMKEGFADTIAKILNEEQETLASLFKEDDQVRWDDPDSSLADQMSPEELKEYRERTFRILEKREENALIGDDVSQIEVHYSELLLQQA